MFFQHMGSIGSIKIARLMDLPPVSLVCGLVTNGTPDMYYPLPLLQQWMKITGSVHDSPSGMSFCNNKILLILIL